MTYLISMSVSKDTSLPLVFNNCYPCSTVSQDLRYSTRQTNVLHASKPKSANTAKTSKVTDVKLYNSLPGYITDSPV